MKQAFTLIELLIVVAIIGILAAIAIPNFANARVRANFSRNLADLRTIYNSVEVLRQETNHLPIDVWDYQTSEGKDILKNVFNDVGAVPESQRSAKMILSVLTSPVAYMSSIPDDPFLKNAGDPTERGFETALNTYAYIDEDPNIPDGDMFFFPLQVSDPEVRRLRAMHDGDFLIVSVGPDGIMGNKRVVDGNQLRGLPYNSSNGLRSVGDIFIRCGFCFNDI